jgi:CBS domain-containing protein
VEETTTLILADELGRIKQTAPFDRLGDAVLKKILAAAPLSFHRHGSVICQPELAEPEQVLWLIRQGSVRATAGTGPNVFLPDQTLVVGGLLPLECALAPERPRQIFTASEDSFLWKLEGPSLTLLLHEPVFLRWLAAQWHDDNRRLHSAAANLANSRQIADQALALPARSAGSSEVSCVAPTTTVGEVATLMADRRIGSVVVGSRDKVLGIVTQNDLVRRAMGRRMSYETPVSELMTSAPAMIEDSATVLEAGLEMARHGFRHLLIRNSEGALDGIVSERDLFRVQQQGIVHVFQPIGDADSVEAMVEVAGRVRELTRRVFAQGMEVSQFTRLVSSINDHMTQRLLSLIVGPPDPDRRFCWLAFGSEGREEQGFVTDQDNGIVFVAPPGRELERVRADYLALASRVNDALHACGFERCKGNIMAGNPQWCLSLDEWKGKFSKWINSTTPTAILNSTIFFDFRAIHGEHALAEAMRDHLLEAVKGNTIFLHLLAKNALDVAPPVGRFNRFATAGGAHKGTVDLKTQGSRLFVDIARIYALATGVRATGTEQRLRLAGQRSRRSPNAIEGDIAAFRFIQKVRLQRQLESLADGRDANRVDPYLINEVEQRTLRESFRQAQAQQDRLRLDYQR